MTDIEALKERLRTHDDERLYREADVLMSEAADALAQLQAENAELQQAKRNLSGLLDAALGQNEALKAENAALKAKLQLAYDKINACIKPGPLSGNGHDETAERKWTYLGVEYRF